ncbi:GNAT family N-acetyltransferase [Lysobacter sp. CA199]|uniref:GNAT family N-acetyltransferase n=1 Tax=Lysobacter sp. CA199 TaxID=3455608 RepID=UPI003F8D256F
MPPTGPSLPACEPRAARQDEAARLWALRTRAVRAGCVGHYDAATVAIWSASPLPDSYPRLIAAGGAVLIEEGDELLCYGIVDLERAEVEAMFVAPEHGGRGLGARLMGEIEAIARDHGLSALTVASSLNATAFYRSVGFNAIGEAAYPHPSGVTLACVHMRKSL